MNRKGLIVLTSILLGCGRDNTTSIPGLSVPEGFVVEEAVMPGLVKYPMFATLDHTGRLFVSESSGRTTSTEDILQNPTFFIRLLEDTDDDGVYDKSTIYADSIPYPMGGAFYRGSFYTAAPPDLLRLTDTDNDGVADHREVVLSGWVLNHNAATLSGPFVGPDGWMYLCDARRGFDITTKEGIRLTGNGANIWRCRPDGTGLEVVSGGGFDNTIEMTFMPTGETIGTMTYFTDPRDGFRDAIMHWVEGGVYPKEHRSIDADKLKLTGELMPVMTKLARVSHAGIMRYRSGIIGDAYEGNLFTAEFNTGRLMRYKVTTDGATYRTESEPFMTSSIPDFHPTDVLEDGDGSILFINTGGWFIAGCPLSVVAKTDVVGGIYRIRQTDGRLVKDPFGRAIDFKSIAEEELVQLMSDPRPVVRDNAVEALVMRGERAIGPLEKLLASSDSEEARIQAVFTLYRIGTPGAIGRVVGSLNDNDAGVRVAAARACGLARIGDAVDKLLQLVMNDEPAVRRQAATALGQIGDGKVVERLLAAAADVEDRFVEHAITFALIRLGRKEPLINALTNASSRGRKVALVALDQMDGSPLQKQHILPLLASQDSLLRHTALWVLPHRLEWSDVVLTFLQNSNAEDRDTYVRLIVKFANDPAIQQWVTGRLASHVPDEEKSVLLDAMRQTRLKTFPQQWTDRLGALLTQGSAEIQERVLSLITSRGIKGLETRLTQMFADERLSPAFRLKALSARLVERPKLSTKEFAALQQFMDSAQVATVRQSAVRVLGLAELDDNQRVAIARSHVAQADPFLLPGLVAVFEGSESEEAGQLLVDALMVSPERLEMLSLPDLQRVVSSLAPGAREKSQALVKLVEQRHAARLSALEALEKTFDAGDVAAGRALFYGKALCSTCHAVSGNGANFGPDLTNIGEIRSQHDILEAVVYPSASFAREYETARVTTTSASHTGIVKEQLPESIVLESGPGIAVRIPTADIVSIEPQALSLMPPGLHQQLTTRELSDLMAYLRSLPDGIPGN